MDHVDVEEEEEDRARMGQGSSRVEVGVRVSEGGEKVEEEVEGDRDGSEVEVEVERRRPCARGAKASSWPIGRSRGSGRCACRACVRRSNCERGVVRMFGRAVSTYIS